MCKKLKLYISVIILVCINYSCVTQKNIKYLQPRTDITKQEFPVDSAATYDYKIQKGDILSIQVNSTVATTTDIIDSKFKADKGSSGEDLYGYNVNQDGDVVLPILGKIRLEGLTLKQATDSIQHHFEEYIKYVTIAVKFKGIRFTVLGEVNSPGEKNSAYSRTNMLQAIALCGDFTMHSNRKTVKLIRKEANINKVYILDFTSKDLLLSNKFFLQPNDILIVDARNSRIFNENVKTGSLYVSFLSLGLLLYIRFSSFKQ